ncbi:AlpA family transcriptional regulator [Salmonella enterica]|nr:AlpA family transcriptional regulator [Salmonella enterica]MDJ7049977.1 AlpA family transcriptional regulator [Salmonella enterica]MDJ7339450.1 AlpA family transcriptional regulator [Salmonella enterica]
MKENNKNQQRTEFCEQRYIKNEISGKRLIRVPEVLIRVGFSRTTLYERIKKGSFPDRVKIGLRSVAFVESEIDAWIEKVIAESRCEAEYNYFK